METDNGKQRVLAYVVVLILPMRNGNLIKGFNSLNSVLKGSYPTYEEWKQYDSTCCGVNLSFSSYPTYEEWKLTFTCYFSLLLFCSYPTYEEWKLIPLFK